LGQHGALVKISLDSLLQSLKTERSQGKKIVFTNGCFDILHVGHVRYLAEARACGDVLIVGLNSDASVKQLKGPSRPLQKEEERAEILLALKSVNYTIIFDQPTPLELIQAIEPDVLVKGGDWPIESIVGANVVLARGGEVKSLSFVEGRSTTAVVEKMQGSN
jgi:D-glycero-beta-D-manno-heptose 1-phosphate adenylyltransferase